MDPTLLGDDSNVLALVEAQNPEEAAVAAIVGSGCTCSGLYAHAIKHGDDYVVVLTHTNSQCPLGPVSRVIVGTGLGALVRSER